MSMYGSYNPFFAHLKHVGYEVSYFHESAYTLVITMHVAKLEGVVYVVKA